MLKTITEFNKKHTFLKPKDLLQLASLAKLRSVKKGQHILREGDLSYDSVVVLKGLFRHYVIDKNGVDKTLLFVPEKKRTGSPDTIFQDKPATENIVALEDSLIIKADVRSFDKLAMDNIRLIDFILNDFVWPKKYLFISLCACLLQVRVRTRLNS